MLRESVITNLGSSLRWHTHSPNLTMKTSVRIAALLAYMGITALIIPAIQRLLTGSDLSTLAGGTLRHAAYAVPYILAGFALAVLLARLSRPSTPSSDAGTPAALPPADPVPALEAK